jgi:hypothetical protein
VGWGGGGGSGSGRSSSGCSFLFFGAEINDFVTTVMNFLYHEMCRIFY